MAAKKTATSAKNKGKSPAKTATKVKGQTPAATSKKATSKPQPKAAVAKTKKASVPAKASKSPKGGAAPKASKVDVARKATQGTTKKAKKVPASKGGLKQAVRSAGGKSTKLAAPAKAAKLGKVAKQGRKPTKPSATRPASKSQKAPTTPLARRAEESKGRVPVASTEGADKVRSKATAEVKPTKSQAPVKPLAKSKAPSVPPPKPTASKAKGSTPKKAETKTKATASSQKSEVSRAPLVSIPMPVLTVERKPSIEERSASIDRRLQRQGSDFRRRYDDNLEMSWIYHDSALEGVVYTLDELRAGYFGQPAPSPDSGLQPTYDEVKRHKSAIDTIRKLAAAPERKPVTVALLRALYLILHPEERKTGELKYRKEIPQHRLYFHEYAAPEKIPFKLRQIIDWMNEQDPKKPGQALRFAVKAHYDLLRVFPFTTDSGKVARLVMNLILLRAGLPPAIIHSAERQRYYDAVKTSAVHLTQMVQDSIENALSSVERLLNEHESRTRSFAQ